MAAAPGDDRPLLDEEVGEKVAKPQRTANRDRLVLIYLVSMIVVGCGNRIFNVLQFIPMANYPLFVNLLTTFAYIPTSLCYIFWAERYRKDQLITPEAKAVKERVWIVMGALDSLAGVLQSLAVDKLANGSLVVLLLQAAIPISMIASKIFLRAKYSIAQYVGATLVVGGLLVVLGPSLTGSGTSTGADPGVWSAVLILSCIPMTLSSVYKELNLQGEAEIDAIYLNYKVAVWQFVLSFPLLPPMAIASELKVTDIGTNLWYGLRCFAGYSSVASDNCASAPLFLVLYIVFNLGYNLLIIMLLKTAGSNVLWLSITASVPIADLTFAIPGIPGGAPIGWSVGVGLPIILAGLTIYRFYEGARKALSKYFCAGAGKVEEVELAEH